MHAGDREGGVAHAPADGADEFALVKVDRVRLLKPFALATWFMYVYEMCIHTYIQIYVYIYLYIHMYTHTHTHTHTHTRACVNIHMWV